MKESTGTSNTGNLQEAISKAVSNAIQNTVGADILINWKIESITGEEGGIAGITKLTVKISYDM